MTPTGRPPLPAHVRLSAILRVALTTEDRAAVDAAAERAGLLVPEWARRVLVRAARRAVKASGEVTRA